MKNIISKYPKKIQYLIFSFLSLTILIIFFFIITIVSRIGKNRIEFKYAPFNASITLNDTKIKNNATNYILPGTYTLKVSLENFDSFEEEIIIDNNTTKLFGFIQPNNTEGEKIKQSHEKDYKIVESLYAESAIEQGKKEQKKWPIITNLPIQDSLFSIGYIPNEQNDDIIITIHADDEYTDLALYELKESVGKEILNYNYTFSETLLDFSKPQKSSESTPEKYIRSAFPNTNIKDVYGKSEDNYYYGYIKTTNSNITYCFVLTKEKNSWVLLSTPSPILTRKNSPNVPEDIILKINDF